MFTKQQAYRLQRRTKKQWAKKEESQIQFERDKRQFRTQKFLKTEKEKIKLQSKTKTAECTTNSKDRGAQRERTDTQEGFQQENKDRKVLMCGWTGCTGGTAQTVHSWMDSFRTEQEA